MSERSGTPPKRRGPGGLRLGSVFGIEVRLDASIVLIFALIVVSLAESLFPSWHPDWSRLLNWATATGAAIVFFASLLAHELSHSLMARRRGIEVPRITLFVFGGMAELSAEPKDPRSELYIAIVGPLASLVLGIVFAVLGAMLTPATFAETMMANPERAIAHLGPLATICVWLAPVNVALAVFNLVPGFPLDGGRVLRAIIWWATGDQVVATRRAAQSGRGFSWLLIAYGMVNLFWGHAIEGIWFMVIGWFLGNAAQMGYQQLLLRRALHGLVVGDLMRTRFETIDAGFSLAGFVEERLLRSAQALWPVVEDGRFVGVITHADVAARAEGDRARLRVRDAMRPIDAATVVSPELSGPEAYERLSEMADEPLPVVSRGEVVGLLHGADIFRWLSLHQLRMHA
jgi:Zn-dependent protease